VWQVLVASLILDPLIPLIVSPQIPLDLATIIQSAVVLFVATPVMVQEIFRLREGTLHTVELNTKGWSS